MKRLTTLLTLSLLHLTCNAMHPIVRNFHKSEYKAGTQNWCMAQDDCGTMFFANSSGILEFDGTSWSLRHTDNWTGVRSLYYDSTTEKLWCGASNEIGSICIENGKVRYETARSGENLTYGEIWGIHKVDDKIIARDQHKVYTIENEEIKQHGFNGRITASATIGSRLIVFVENRGAFSTSNGEHFTPISGSAALATAKICSILPYKDALMFVTESDGVWTLDAGGLKSFPLDFADELKKTSIFCAAIDGNTLSLGTIGQGVYIKDLRDGTSMHLDTDSGLQNNTVLSMFYDRDGNLWLGLDKGIDFVRLDTPEFRLFGDPDKYGTGYASAIFDGDLWLGTNQGLYRTRMRSSGIMDDGSIVSVPEIKGQVWSLSEYDGSLFCCHDKGIHVICSRHSSYPIELNGTWKVESVPGHPDRLLGSTYDRMFVLSKDRGRWSFSHYIEGFDEATKAFETDTDGSVWFSHWVKGLFHLTLTEDMKTVEKVDYLSKINGFPEDWSNIPCRYGNRIIFITTKGFYGFDYGKWQAYPLDELNGRFSIPPAGAGIYESPYGLRYYSSGIMQAVEYNDGSPVDSLSLKHIADKRVIGFDSTLSLSSNTLLINTEEGFSIIRTDRMEKRGTGRAYDVFIKNIYSNNSGKDTLIMTARTAVPGTVTLPYSCNSLRFEASCPVYTGNGNVTYSFRLENYDKDWSPFSATNFKEYTKLPHGHYILRVRASESHCMEYSECSAEVNIEAPWFLSGWAFVVYGILLLICGYIFFRLMLMFSAKRAREMAQKKEDEMRQEQMMLEFEHKAQDLAASTMNVIRKNEILLGIDARLEKVADYMVEDRNRSLKLLSKIRKEIRENIQHDDVWQKFEKNFDIVYDDFLKRLGVEYPHLTMADKKMCVYLKMNLSSKEIAPLLNITVRSVEMTRYRLRKKLGLSREASLTEFLQKF